jgi:hypothetical protein
VQAQPQGLSERVLGLNNNLLQLHGRTRGAAPDSAALRELQAVAAQRAQELQELMSTDPAAVLAIALPDDVRNAFPAALRGLIEQHVRLQGEMEVAIEDGRDYSRIHYGLVAGGKRLALHFADEPPANLLTGTLVDVEGVQLGESLALTSIGTTSTAGTGADTSASILPNTFGAQKTLVILVNFQDNTSQPWSPADARSTVFTTASNFWLENSFQQTWIAGDVAGWYTLPISSTTCNTSSIQTYAQQAAQAGGYVLSNYSHYLYMFPAISVCGWQGLSYIGGSPSNSWINGEQFQQVVSHELGHALGLYHSHSLSCGSLVYAASGCTVNEYGDYYDSMANGNLFGDGMHYNASQKERLGWLGYSAQPPITTVSASGIYTLAPYETQDSRPKALKILQSAASGTYYYVESRQAIGFDNILSYAVPQYGGVLNGVVVHVASAANPNTSDLLDMNPSATWGTAMALGVGHSYTDTTAGVTIATTSVSSTGATVQVTLTAPPCVLANPAVTISPAQSSGVTAGSAVSFTITVADKDSSVCNSASFNLASAVPAGWTAVFSSPMLTLAPGGSGSATLQVTSPSGTASGSYSVSASATNAAASSYTASASSTYVISPPVTMSISVATNQSSYTRGQTVKVTVTLMASSSPCSGAAVTVGIVKSNGNVVNLNGTTASNGVVTLSYNLKKNDPTGAYKANGSGKSGGSSASASTPFTVK